VVSASGRWGWEGKAAPAAGGGEAGRCWGRGGDVWWGSSNWRPPGWSRSCSESEAEGRQAVGNGTAAGRRRLPALQHCYFAQAPETRRWLVLTSKHPAGKKARRVRERGGCWAARRNAHSPCCV
jgi:hypothetical protein